MFQETLLPAVARFISIETRLFDAIYTRSSPRITLVFAIPWRKIGFGSGPSLEEKKFFFVHLCEACSVSERRDKFLSFAKHLTKLISIRNYIREFGIPMSHIFWKSLTHIVQRSVHRLNFQLISELHKYFDNSVTIWPIINSCNNVKRDSR